MENEIGYHHAKGEYKKVHSHKGSQSAMVATSTLEPWSVHITLQGFATENVKSLHISPEHAKVLMDALNRFFKE